MKTKKLFAAAIATLSIISMAAIADAASFKIGDAEYDTLADAVKSAGTAPSTITLTEDINVTSGVTIGADQDITLDLGTYTINANLPDCYDSDGMAKSALFVNNGKLTLLGDEGSEISTSASSVTVLNNEGAELIVGEKDKKTGLQFVVNLFGDILYNNGGNITVNYANFDATGGSGGTAFTSWGGNTTVNAAYISTEITAILYDGNIAFNNDVIAATKGLTVCGGTLNLNGCTMVSDAFIFDDSFESGANISITGGEYNFSEVYLGKINMTITGGTFNANSDAFAPYLAEGKEFDENGNVVDVKPAEPTLSEAKAFVDTDDTNTIVGYYFDAKAAANVNTAVATFTSETDKRTVEKTLNLSSISGNGDVEFSILLLNAPLDVKGSILYK